jgi:hypothetical protein
MALKRTLLLALLPLTSGGQCVQCFRSAAAQQAAGIAAMNRGIVLLLLPVVLLLAGFCWLVWQRRNP